MKTMLVRTTACVLGAAATMTIALSVLLIPVAPAFAGGSAGPCKGSCLISNGSCQPTPGNECSGSGCGCSATKDSRCACHK